MTKARKRYDAAVEKRKLAEAAISAHEKTYCPDTMEKTRHFQINLENGTHLDCVEEHNLRFNPAALQSYEARYHELDRELAKCKDEESRAFFLLQIIEAPLNLIRFVRWCFKGLFGFCKHIEEETRPK